MSNTNNVNRVIQCEGCGEDVAIKRGADRMCVKCQFKARREMAERAAAFAKRHPVVSAPKSYPNEPFYAGL